MVLTPNMPEIVRILRSIPAAGVRQGPPHVMPADFLLLPGQRITSDAYFYLSMLFEDLLVMK